MEILNEFGVDIRILFAQIVNFLIIFFILKRYAYKPVLELLKNRKKAIQEGIEKAEEARLMLEKAETREKEVLKNAQSQARKLLEETEKQRKESLEKTQVETHKLADKMLQEARNQISFETKQAEKRLAAHISELSVTFLQKSLSDLFTEHEQEVIMKNALKKMKKKAD